MQESIEFEIIYNLVYKITLTPNNPKRLLEKGLVHRLYDELHECIAINGWNLDALTFEKDHVTIIIGLTPEISVDGAVKIFKRVTENVVRKEFKISDALLLNKKFWADGYDVETVGDLSTTDDCSLCK